MLSPLRFLLLTLLNATAAFSAAAEDFSSIDTAHSQKISLQEAVLRALTHNLELKLQVDLTRESEAAFGQSLGIYDFQLDSENGYTHDRNEPLFIFASSKKLQFSSNSYLSRLLPSGTLLSAGWLQLWEENSYSSTFNTLNPYWKMGFEFKVSQPLLKNAFGFSTRRLIQQAESAWKTASLYEQARMEQLIAETEKAYWELASSYQLYQIKKLSLQQAQNLHNYNRTESLRGVAEKIDLLASEAHLEGRKAELQGEEANLIEASRLLKQLLDDTSPAPLLPAQELQSVKDKIARQPDTLSCAFTKRADLRGARQELQSSTLEKEAAGNARLPSLDLVASVTSTGLDKSYNNSLDKSLKYKYPVYYVGGTLHFPLENREAKYALLQAHYRKERAELKVSALEHQIAIDVTRLYHQIELTAATIKNAQKAQRLLSQKLAERERQFRMGRVPLQLVIDDQDHLIAGKMQTLSALKSYHLLKTELAWAEGRLAEKYLYPATQIIAQDFERILSRDKEESPKKAQVHPL